MALMNFDATQHKPDDAPGGTLRVYPAGLYPVLIVGTEIKPNKKGSGVHLEVTHHILDGQFSGAVFTDWLTLTDPENQIEASKGQSRMSSLCAALGLMRVGDSSELHNKAYVVELEHSAANGSYKARNFVKSRKPFGGGGAPHAAAPGMPAPQSFAPAPQSLSPAPAAAPAQAPNYAPQQPSPAANPATPAWGR